jgi:hypothetical protein
MDEIQFCELFGQIQETHTDINEYAYSYTTYLVLENGKLVKRYYFSDDKTGCIKYASLQDAYDEAFRQEKIQTLCYYTNKSPIFIPPKTSGVRSIVIQYKISGNEYHNECLSELRKIAHTVVSLRIVDSSLWCARDTWYENFISDLFSMFPNIERLELESLIISSKISFALRSILPRLTTLELSGVRVDANPRDDISRYLRSMLRNATNLSTFTYRRNASSLTSFGWSTTAERRLQEMHSFNRTVRALEAHGRLVNVSLCGFPYLSVQEECWEQLWNALPVCTDLRLGTVRIDEVGARSLCRFLQQERCHVQTLDLKFDTVMCGQIILPDETYSLFAKTCASWRISHFNLTAGRSECPDIFSKRPDIVYPKNRHYFWSYDEAIEWVSSMIELYPLAVYFHSLLEMLLQKQKIDPAGRVLERLDVLRLGMHPEQ